MKTENFFGMNNSINKKRKLYPLNLTWNKFRKAKKIIKLLKIVVKLSMQNL